MAVTYDGSLYWGPVSDDARFYAYAGPTLPASHAWSMVWMIRREHTFGGTDPADTSSTFSMPWGNTTGGGGGGNDIQLRFPVANSGTTGIRMKPSVRIRRGGVDMMNSAGAIASSVALDRDKAYTLVLSYDGVSTINWRACEKGGSIIAMASGTANATFTGSSRALGTLNVGSFNFADEVQCIAAVNRELTDAEIEDWADGVDPETLVISGDRLLLHVYSSPAATISPTWGSGDATRNGTWTNRPTSSPMVPLSGSSYITCNEPLPYWSPGLAPGATTAVCEFSGTYAGFTPSAVEGRIIQFDGTVIVNWTALSSFSAAAGAWSGSLTVPAGNGYVLQLRDGVDGTKTWNGRHPWRVGPVVVLIGQSPQTIFESAYQSIDTLTGNSVMTAYVDDKTELFLGNADCLGAGPTLAANQFSTASSGKSLHFIFASVGGTSSLDWAEKDTGLWDRMMAMIQGSRCKQVDVVWLNGVSDASFSSADIKTNHNTIYANLADDLTSDLGIGFTYTVIPHNRSNGSASNQEKVRKAQWEWVRDHADKNTKVFLGPPYIDIPMDGEFAGSTTTFTTSTITLAATTNVLTANLVTYIKVTDSNGTQTRTVSAFNQSTRVATVSSNFSPALTGTVTYVTGSSSPHQGYEGCRRMGGRLGQMVARRHGYSSTREDGPTITSAKYPNGGDGSIIDVTLTHASGTALRTPRDGAGSIIVYGFEVSEDNFSTTETISSVVISNATTVRIALSGAPSDKTALKVRYLFGEPVQTADWQRIEDTLYDNNGVGVQSGSPVWPTFDALAVTEAAAASGGGGFIGSGYGGLILGA